MAGSTVDTEREREANRGRSVTVAAQRVCRSSIGPLPLPLSRFSFHPIRRRRQHPIPIRPVCAGGWGLGGRRREADKRIALSSRNDIFDQHFHTAPARGARSSRAHHPGASLRERESEASLSPSATTPFAQGRNLL